jgi:hypothetical protein
MVVNPLYDQRYPRKAVIVGNDVGKSRSDNVVRKYAPS